MTRARDRIVVLVLLAACSGPNVIQPPAPPPALRPAPSIERIAALYPAIHGMAVSPDGALWFADSFKSRSDPPEVFRLDPPYDADPDPTGLRGTIPAGMAFIRGRLWACDAGDGTLTRYDVSLRAEQTWQIQGAWNVAPAGEDRWLVTTFGNEVVQATADGATRVVLSELEAPFDLVPVADGTLWVSEQGAVQGAPGRVSRWNADGTAAETVEYAWENPEGMAFDATGHLWVAETERHELVRVAKDGSVASVHPVAGLPVVITPALRGSLLVSVTGEDPHLLQITTGTTRGVSPPAGVAAERSPRD